MGNDSNHYLVIRSVKLPLHKTNKNLWNMVGLEGAPFFLGFGLLSDACAVQEGYLEDHPIQ